jgi:hypothetical protein
VARIASTQVRGREASCLIADKHLKRDSDCLPQVSHLLGSGQQMRQTGDSVLTTCRVDELRAHPSYVQHQLSVSTSKMSALDKLGPLAFQDPLIVTRDHLIIDGYARWELAKSRGIAILHCLEYAMTHDEALCLLLQKQRRSDGLNDFVRILLALDLEPFFRQKARINQQAGGRGKGSSTLTSAERIDSRKEIAQLLGVSSGNVSKVKRIRTHACSAVQQAVRNREISINLAEKWSHDGPVQQIENLRLRRIRRGIKKKARDLVMAHLRQVSQPKLNKPEVNVSELLRLVARLSALPPEGSKELGPIVIAPICVPGKGMFITEELLQALKSNEETV